VAGELLGAERLRLPERDLLAGDRLNALEMSSRFKSAPLDLPKMPIICFSDAALSSVWSEASFPPTKLLITVLPGEVSITLFSAPWMLVVRCHFPATSTIRREGVITCRSSPPILRILISCTSAS
jgi:hypothetical protein